jgi:4-amino-4-deoxy-L-arabinose transferase-like glycosyltransferase
VWAIGALLLVRLGSLALYPLMDNTEARYADIARRMLVSGDWVTLWFSDSQPFWGKPPLSIWVTALSFKVFGVNEFAARLPHLMIGVAVAGLVWWHARRISSRAAWHATAWLGASSLFFVASGSVMTDMTMTLGTTLVMVGFWNALHADKPGGAVMPWCMVFGAMVGLLAKGPVSAILWGAPIVAWLVVTGRLGLAWQRVAWLRGATVVLVLTLPWYLWAESRTPGFVEYFIVGEHWNRFVNPGWTGDLYGSAHQFPRGSIWVFALGAIAPWPLLLPVMLPARHAAPAARAAKTSDGEASYLWLWALTPCLFFTLAGNILWTYVLPGLPAFALLAGRWTATRQRRRWAEAVVTAGVLASAAVTSGLLIAARDSSHFDRRSARSLVSDFKSRSQSGEPLYFLGRVPFSASFYSNGQARPLESVDALPAGQVAFIVLSDARLAAMPVEQRARLTPLVHSASGVLARWN